MRIRTVKPQFFTHELLYEAEIEEGVPVRLGFQGLWLAADREGRFKWEPRRLKLAILPYDEIDFSRVLHACLTRGLLVKYRVNDDWFGWIPSFKRNQVINHKEQQSTLPQVEDAEEVVDACSMRGSRVEHASTTRDSRVPGGKEGKGREGKGILSTQTAALTFDSQDSNIAVLVDGVQIKKKDPKYKAVYKPIALYCEEYKNANYRDFRVSGQDAKMLNEIGELYSEAEFRAMLKAIAKDHLANGKPWNVLFDVYRGHASWRISTAKFDPQTDDDLDAAIAAMGNVMHDNASPQTTARSDQRHPVETQGVVNVAGPRAESRPGH